MSDTLETPPEGIEEETPPVEDNIPEEPQEPTVQEMIDMALEKQSQQMRSWQGRKEKALLDSINDLIKEKVKTPEPQPEFDFENPLQQVEQLVEKKLSQRETEANKFTQSVVNAAGALMESDELFQDQELGNEVVEVIRKDINKIKRGVSPDVSAELLVSGAVKKVYANRIKAKKTAFDGRAPTNVPGTVKPAGNKKVATMPKLSKEAQKLVKKFGYSAEEVNKIFGDE